MNFRAILLLLTVCFPNSVSAQIGWQWVSGSTAEGYGVWGFGQKSVVTNKFGNTFVSVTNSGDTANFGPIGVSNPTRIKQLVLAKYDDNGNPKWILSSRDVQVEPISMVADDRDNLYLLLFNTGKGQIGSEWVNTSNQTTLLFKISSAGAVVWVQQINVASGRGLALDNSGNLFVTGVVNSFTGTEKIGKDTLTIRGGSDVVVLKYSQGGTLKWAKRYGGEAGDHTAQSGGLYQSCTSTVRGEMIIAIRGQSPTMQNYYIIKIDGDGNLLWQKDLPWIDDDVRGLATDSKGNIYLTGGVKNAIFHKYSSEGDLLFAKYATETKTVGDDISIDVCDNVWVQGPVWGNSISVDNNIASTPNGPDPMFIAGFDENGNVLLTKIINSGGNVHGFVGISVDNRGHFFVAGQYLSSLFLDGYSLSTDASAAMFIAKFRYGLWCDMAISENGLNNENEIFAFPNPVKNMLSIESKSKIAQVHVSDIFGRIVISSVPNETSCILSLTEFPAGLYFVSINGNKPIKVTKEQ